MKRVLDGSEAVSMLLEGLGRSQIQEQCGQFKFKGHMCPDNWLWERDAVHDHRVKDLEK